jgi:hypothetical protein
MALGLVAIQLITVITIQFWYYEAECVDVDCILLGNTFTGYANDLFGYVSHFN